MRRSDVVAINGKQKLVKPMEEQTGNVLYYVTNEEMLMYFTELIHQLGMKREIKCRMNLKRNTAT